MDIKLDSIQIFVSDIKKAKNWYSKIIGMKFVDEDSKLKILHMKLGKTDFFVETPNPKWGRGWNTVKVGGRTQIIFATKNIKETVKFLKQRNVKIVEEISKRPWGQYKAVFADHDDNEFNLIEEK